MSRTSTTLKPKRWQRGNGTVQQLLDRLKGRGEVRSEHWSQDQGRIDGDEFERPAFGFVPRPRCTLGRQSAPRRQPIQTPMKGGWVVTIGSMGSCSECFLDQRARLLQLGNSSIMIGTQFDKAFLDPAFVLCVGLRNLIIQCAEFGVDVLL